MQRTFNGMVYTGGKKLEEKFEKGFKDLPKTLKTARQSRFERQTKGRGYPIRKQTSPK